MVFFECLWKVVSHLLEMQPFLLPTYQDSEEHHDPHIQKKLTN